MSNTVYRLLQKPLTQLQWQQSPPACPQSPKILRHQIENHVQTRGPACQANEVIQESHYIRMRGLSQNLIKRQLPRRSSRRNLLPFHRDRMPCLGVNSDVDAAK
jgi:hypothetical protein